jgi:hypothetical protein
MAVEEQGRRRKSKDGSESARSASRSEAAEHTVERETSCMGDGCEWQGKEPHLCPPPLPVIYRIQGSNTPENSACGRN